MVKMTAKQKDRIVKGVKKFQPILVKAKAADINESDTVTIITDMLSEVFGYDKYANITSEFAIKKTFCDLAIKLEDGKVPLLIECKAIGLELKDDFVRQATNYAADSGIDWVVLTNGAVWRVYKVIFAKPIEKELVYEFDMTEINVKKDSSLEMLYFLCIEAFAKSSKSTLEDLYSQKQVMNRYVIGQLIMSEDTAAFLRKQIKKIYPDIKPSVEEISEIIRNEILKREVVEGEDADDAHKKVQRLLKASTPKAPKPKPAEQADAE